MVRKFLFILYILIFKSLLTFGQSTCQNAIQDQLISAVNLPPVGSTAPFGPAYGCLTLFDRPFWGYLISCDSTTTGLWFELDSTTSSVEVSLIIWGPFTNKDLACSNLTSNKIYACVDRINYSGGALTTLPAVYAKKGEFFFYMLTTTDIIPNNTVTTMHGIFQPNAGNPYKCFDCNGEVSSMYQQNICMVTFDTTSQKTKVIWEKEHDSGVAGYNIYRKDINGSILMSDSIAYISAISTGEFVDYSSSPLLFAEKYKIVPVDSCGNMYSLFHYTSQNACFLQTFPSGNNSAQLLWNFFGAPYTDFELFQYVYRGGTPQTMQIIDTIPYSVTNYSDNNAPPGNNFYAVEKRKLVACNPLRTGAQSNVGSVISNLSSVTVTGMDNLLNELQVIIMSQPVDDQLILKFNNSKTIKEILIYNLEGKLVMNSKVLNNPEIVNVSTLPSGIYWLSIPEDKPFYKKFIKIQAHEK